MTPNSGDPAPPPQTGLDWKDVLNFVRTEAKANREYFDWLVKISYGALVAVMVIAGALLWKSLSDVRKEAQDLVRAELRTERIRETIGESLRESGAIQKALSEEVNRQVASELKRIQPSLQQLISGEAQKQINSLIPQRSLRPDVRTKLAAQLRGIKPMKVLIDAIGRPGSETYIYAAQLRDVFNENGWRDFVTLRSVDSTPLRYRNLTLLVSNLGARSVAGATAFAISERFVDLGLITERNVGGGPWEIDDSLPEDTMRLLVQPKRL